MLRDPVVVVVVVRTHPQAIPLAKITMRKSTHGFPFVSHMSMGLRYYHVYRANTNTVGKLANIPDVSMSLESSEARDIMVSCQKFKAFLSWFQLIFFLLRASQREPKGKNALRYFFSLQSQIAVWALKRTCAFQSRSQSLRAFWSAPKTRSSGIVNNQVPRALVSFAFKI